jgi:hypothetical protein
MAAGITRRFCRKLLRISGCGDSTPISCSLHECNWGARLGFSCCFTVAAQAFVSRPLHFYTPFRRRLLSPAIQLDTPVVPLPAVRYVG